MERICDALPKCVANRWEKITIAYLPCSRWLIITTLILLTGCAAPGMVNTSTPFPASTAVPPRSTETAAVFPTLTSTETLTSTLSLEPSLTPEPHQVVVSFNAEGVTVPDSCKAIPAATADNTLTLNGKPLPDGTVIDTYQALVDIHIGKYHQPTLLVAARAVAIEKLSPIQVGNQSVDRYLLCYNVMLPSGENMVLATVFENTQQDGFQNISVFTLPDIDVTNVILDQTAKGATIPIKGNNRHWFCQSREYLA